MLVELRSDLLAGSEFDRIVVTLMATDDIGGPPLRMSESSARVGEEFIEGRRVAELQELPPGDYAVRVRLLLGAMEVAERIVIVRARRETGITILISRRCAAINCPGPGDPSQNLSCVAGQCVDPRCTTAGDSYCPPPECATSSDCASPAACAPARCADGVCLYAPVPGACDTPSVCDPMVGCVDRSMPDGGMDAGDASGADACGDACTPVPPWFDADWSYRKAIDVRAAMVPSDQLSFPLYVGFDADADLAAGATSADLVFTASDGRTVLPFETESYDPATGRLAAWVQLPTLSGTTDTRVFLYYGNAAATTREDAAGVWDTMFEGVWHLGESPGDDPLFLDSTSNDNDLSMFGAMDPSDRVRGTIGDAIDFDGVDDRLTSGASTSLGLTAAATVSAWVSPRVWAENSGIIASRSTAEGSTNRDYALRSGMNDLSFGFYDGASFGATYGGWDVLDEWHYIVGTYDGMDVRLFFDGVEVTSNAHVGAIRDSGKPFNIGSSGIVDATRTWDGVIDEVRVSSFVRSATWILTEYENQSDPSGFLLVGPQEAR